MKLKMLLLPVVIFSLGMSGECDNPTDMPMPTPTPPTPTTLCNRVFNDPQERIGFTPPTGWAEVNCESGFPICRTAWRGSTSASIILFTFGSNSGGLSGQVDDWIQSGPTSVQGQWQLVDRQNVVLNDGSQAIRLEWSQPNADPLQSGMLIEYWREYSRGYVSFSGMYSGAERQLRNLIVASGATLCAE